MAQAHGKTGTRGKTGETRAKIIEKASSLFLKNGAHNTTVQMIANEIGITQAGVYKHFADKDEVIVACCLHAADLGRDYIRSLVPDKASAEDRLKAYIAANLKWAAEKKEQSHAILSLHYFAGSSNSVKKLDAEINARREAIIREFLVQGRDEGTWKTSDPAVIARNIQSFLIGEMIRAHTWPREEDLQDRSARAWKAVRSLLSS